jgi:hypothetical protein
MNCENCAHLHTAAWDPGIPRRCYRHGSGIWSDATSERTGGLSIQCGPEALYLQEGAPSEDPAPAPTIPEAVTPRQIRLALIGIGVFPEAITSALGSIPDQVPRAKALAEWEFATEVARAHPLIGMLGAALGQSPAQIDALFIAAAGL